MNMTDPIADMLTRIRNGVGAHLDTVDVAPVSKVKLEIARILKEEGSVITGIKRISKPGLRVYAKQENVPTVLNGLGIAIISTSEGMMTDKEARKKHAGGEVIAYVW